MLNVVPIQWRLTDFFMSCRITLYVSTAELLLNKILFGASIWQTDISRAAVEEVGLGTSQPNLLSYFLSLLSSLQPLPPRFLWPNLAPCVLLGVVPLPAPLCVPMASGTSAGSIPSLPAVAGPCGPL